MRKLSWYTRACALFAALATAAVLLPAQTFKTLDSFDDADGAAPWATLVQGSDGSFFGTTQKGGNTACALGCGTIFQITPSGTLTMFSFDGTNGSDPYAGLLQAAHGDFYGVTSTGGASNGGGRCANNCGTVFKIAPGGKLTTLHNFDWTDGAIPTGTPIQAADGNFYGTTQIGGAVGSGSIFKITSSGSISSTSSELYGTISKSSA